MACTAIAISLNHIYPSIPASFQKLEWAQWQRQNRRYLVYIVSSLSPVAIGLCAVGLAAAAMSSADTFVTSGGSCLSRDIYQRYIKPDATMKQMMTINRVSVLILVALATVLSFYIDSIIDVIHIATFIASAAYFFPLMGGLYWKRATKEGALAGLIVGAVVQIALTAVDLANTAPFATAYLDTIHPVLSNHGVIVGMLLSGVAFFGVSLATKPSDTVNLAPFFADEADKLEKEAMIC
ncbi:MAG: hypothetical protein R2741_03015 [Methanolobus sp.]